MMSELSSGSSPIKQEPDVVTRQGTGPFWKVLSQTCLEQQQINYLMAHASVGRRRRRNELKPGGSWFTPILSEQTDRPLLGYSVHPLPGQ
jgi:hypothetical protein